MWQIADTFADQQINPPGYRMTQKESSFSRFSILIGGSCSSFLLLRCRDIVACDFSGRGANMKQPATSIYIYVCIPSGKLSQNYGKTPFSMGKSTINGQFSIAVCMFTRGYIYRYTLRLFNIAIEYGHL